MAEEQPAKATEKPKSGSGTGLNKKYLHVPLWAWGVGAGGLAAVGYVLWKRAAGSSSSGTASTATTGTSTSAVTNCTDSNGNPIPCTQASSGGVTGTGGGTYGYGGYSSYTGTQTGTSSTGTNTSGSTSSTGTTTGTSSTGTTTGSTSSSGSGAPQTGPDPVVAQTTSSTLTVSWPAVGGSTGYEVLVNGPEGSVKSDVKVSTTKASFSIATTGTNGSVKVRAFNTSGYGPWSASKTFSFTSGTGSSSGGGTSSGSGGSKSGTPQTGPDPVTASASGSDLTVSWPAVGGATQYEVLVSGPEGSVKSDVKVTQTHAVFSSATTGTNGSVKVRAGNAAGYGPWSASKTWAFPTAKK